MILGLFLALVSVIASGEVAVEQNDVKIGDANTSSGTYQMIVPRMKPRFARYCSSSSSSRRCCPPSPYCCSSSSSSSSSCSSSSSSSSSSSCSSSSSSSSSSSVHCFACNQEMTYSFSTPDQIKFINVTLGKKCRPDCRGRYNKHCFFEVLSDNKRIYSSKKPCGPITMGSGLHDVSMRLFAPDVARLSTSSINPDCPPASTGICYNFEHYAKVCFCSALM